MSYNPNDPYKNQQSGYPPPYYPPQMQPGNNQYPPHMQPGNNQYPPHMQPGNNQYPPQGQPGNPPYPPYYPPGTVPPAGSQPNACYPTQPGQPNMNPQGQYPQPYPPQPYQNPQYAYPNYPPGTMPPMTNQGQPGYPPQPYPQYGQPGVPQPGYPQQGYPGAPGTSYPPHGMAGTKKDKRQKYVHAGPCMPSLRPMLNASPAADAATLHKAFRGLGCDSGTVISILTHRSCAQREQIKVEYQKQFNKSLIERTKSELYEPLERVMVLTLYSGSEQDAYIVRRATKGIGTNEDALRYILCTRSSAQIAQVKASYSKLFSATAEKHIVSDTSGSFQKILLMLLNQPRDQSTTVDMSAAHQKVAELYSRNPVRINAPDSLMQIFCLTNYEQLRAIFYAFYTTYNQTMYNYLKGYYTGEYVKTLMDIYSFVTNPLHHQSKILRTALTEHRIHTVIIVVTTRCEIDLGTILHDYQMMYGKDFPSQLKKEFDEEYPDTVKALFSLMGCL